MLGKPAVSMPLGDSRALEFVLRNCREHGFGGVILKPDQYESFLGDPAGFIGRWGDQAPRIAGLEVRAAVATDEGGRRLDQVIRLAVGIDGDLLILICEGPPLASRPDRAGAVVSAIHEIGEKARSGGLRLLAINRRDTALESPADVELFLDNSDSRRVGLALDTAHLLACGEAKPEEIIGLACDRLEAVYLKDAVRGRLHVLEEYRIEFPPHGEGDVDFQSMVDLLKGIEYGGWLVVDHEVIPADPADALSRAAGFLRSFGIGVG